MPTEAQLEDAKQIVAWYTVAASATGAVPLPAASAAVIAETGAMLTHVSSRLGIEIGWANVLESLGLAASLNVLGRNLFIEGAKLLGWGTGNVWAAVALSGLGATTAGVQTYIIGRLTIEIGKNDGRPITPKAAAVIIEDARASYDSVLASWKKAGVQKPPAFAAGSRLTNGVAKERRPVSGRRPSKRRSS